MYENPFDRKFGIEFEFACPNIPRAGTGYDGDRKRTGFENLLEENRLDDFHVGFDGSEWEIKSPILQGPTGFKKVKRFLELITYYGAYTTSNDGLHVHHDAPEFIDNPEPVWRLVENWYNNQAQIFKMVHHSRRNGWACPSWQPHEVIDVKTHSRPQDRYGRKNLNIASLRRHGTIEVRLLEGTVNYDEILSWVRFGQAFIGKALDETDGYLGAAETPIELMQNIKVSRNASRFLSRKIQPVSTL